MNRPIREGAVRRIALGFVALAFLLAGESALAADAPGKDSRGIEHLDEPRVRDLAQLPDQEWSTRVVASEERWQSSGIVVQRGSLYSIEANGEWQNGGFCNKTGAGGQGVYTLLCFLLPGMVPIVPTLSIGALVAKIGADGPPFGVGDRHMLEADRTGVLYFRINEMPGWAWDNTGHVTARIKGRQLAVAAPTPPPAQLQQPPRETSAPLQATLQPQRDVLPTPAPAATDQGPGVRSQFWAVVVGVSDYADSRIPQLRYANTDARAFHDWLVSAEGGRYAPARTRLLLDRDATSANIKDALYNWLRQTIEEDVVIIYFAGHGSPDSPQTPQNLYLLPHDTRYDSIAATGFPMWDIETALRRFIKARRVIVIADACHSGGVGAGFDFGRRNTSPEANQISRGLQNLATIGQGIAVLSASDDKQESVEGVNFGGGHGAFTWYLLQGLRGEADYNRMAA